MGSPSIRTIGFWSATAIVAGSIIGSGIFMKPSTMAAQLGSPVWLILVWVIAGVFSLLGAMIFAELGAMMPQNGGSFVYFKPMYGEFFSFLFGWSCFAVINTAAVAAMSYVCASYADYFLHLPRFDPQTELSVVWQIPYLGKLYPLQNFGVKALSILLILALSLINYVSVKGGTRLQLVSTIIKLFVIAALVSGIFLSGNGSFSNLFDNTYSKQGTDLITGIVAALTGAFYAYDGWINTSFIAGEIKKPGINIPRSLVLGTITCILVYVLVNIAYLYVLPVNIMASSSLVASDALAVALGKTSAVIVAVLIVICTFGAINGNILTTVRVTYVMGKDRLFIPWAGKEHPKFRSPGNALILHAIWISILIISGSFDMLADMFVFITWIVYAFGAIGLILLRRKMKDAERPYKVWGYPWVPLLFILFTGFYLVLTVYNDITNYTSGKSPFVNSLFGLVLVLAGTPIYLSQKSKVKSQKLGTP